MALIKCPECQREVSDQAKACIHCGYPLDKLETDGLFQVMLVSAGENEVKVTGTFRKISGMDLLGAVNFIRDLPAVIMNGLTYEDAKFVENMFLQIGAELEICRDSSSTTRYDFHKRMAERKEEAKKIHCPICGSTDIGVVSGEIRVFNGFGGSGRAQNACKRCGHQWVPRL